MEKDTTNYTTQSELLKDFIENVFKPNTKKSAYVFDGAPKEQKNFKWYTIRYSLILGGLENTCSAYDISIGFEMNSEKYKTIKKEILFFLLQDSFNSIKTKENIRCLYIHLNKNQLEEFSREMFDALGIKYLFSYMGNHDELVYSFVKLVDDENYKVNNEDDEDDEWY